MPEQGVFYVATEQARFLDEASHSVASLKRCLPDVHVTLFTDRLDAARERCRLFDAFEALPLAEGLGTSWGSGLLGKVRAFLRAPYAKSLYLDTDTRVRTPRLADLFEQLDAYELAIAPCEEGESRGQSLSGRPMFNSGVIAFRAGAPNVRRLLQAWLELQEAHALAVRQGDPDRFEYVRGLDPGFKLYQLVADQTSLARYLSPEVNTFDVRCLTLSRLWNWRADEIDEELAGQVVVHHARRFKVPAP